MKDDVKKNETSTLKKKRSTEGLEQIPSSKKRSLTTGVMATPFTHQLDEQSEARTDEIERTQPMPMDAPIPETAPHNKVNVTPASTSAAQVADKANISLPSPKPAPAPQEVAKVTPPENKIEINDPVKSTSPIAKSEAAINIVKSEAAKEAMKAIAKESVRSSVRETSKEALQEASRETKKEHGRPTSAGDISFGAGRSTSFGKDDIESKTDEYQARRTDVAVASAGVTRRAISDVATEVKPSAMSGAKADDEGSVHLLGSLEAYDQNANKEVVTRLDRFKTFLLFAVPTLIIIGLAITIIMVVPGLKEKVQEKLPTRIASLMGVPSNIGTQLTVQADPIVYDEKAQTATLSGTVNNLTEQAMGPIQIEFLLSRREDVRKTENKLVALEPAQIPAKGSAKYQFTISTKEFQDAKILSTLNNNAKIKFKNLGVAEPKYQPATPAGPTPAQPDNKPKTSDDKIYDGTVN